MNRSFHKYDDFSAEVDLDKEEGRPRSSHPSLQVSSAHDWMPELLCPFTNSYRCSES
jgi:hypothetical protein